MQYKDHYISSYTFKAYNVRYASDMSQNNDQGQPSTNI